jgi:hypothetical protein
MNVTQESQGASQPASPSLDLTVYLGTTAWVVALVLVCQRQGQSELRHVLVYPEADDEFSARGKATMLALNANPGFMLSTLSCVRVTAVPTDS